MGITDADGRADVWEPGWICRPGTARCRDRVTRLVCSEDGTREEAVGCQEGLRCDDDSGTCREKICTPGEFEGCASSGMQRYCNPSGTEIVEGLCPGGADCVDGRCEDAECEQGVVRCLDDKNLEVCNAAGAFVPGEACPLGTECFNGECEKLCELNKKVSSYIGCEYWSVDLDNYDRALSQPHAVVVTNPNPELDARVTIRLGYSDRELTQDASGEPFRLDIGPGEARIFTIPSSYDISGTKIFDNHALRITSTIPVVAHQFNPLNNTEEVYSNDGTVLLPTNVVGSEYYGMSWPYRGGRVNIFGFLTVVNSQGAPNKVRITPSAQIASGRHVDTGEEIPLLEPGITRTFELAPGEVLNLATTGAERDRALVEGCLDDDSGSPESVTPCPDLTGTHIEADAPITVFGGHQCANVIQGIDRCDHIESILLPKSAWGSDYVGSKFVPRAETTTPEPDVWRVIAGEDGTQIQTRPVIDGVHGTTLDAGEWRQFSTTEAFRLGSSKPVMLAQYMVGSNWTGIPRVCDEGIDARNPTGIGDPAMTVAVPRDQFREDYIVLTPRDYDEDYINVIRPRGATIRLDGEPIDDDAFEALADDPFEVAQIEVEDGFHRLDADVRFGVVSYGYDCHVSYAYPGGMNVETVVDRR
jgi:hypothetical protein